MLVFFIGFPTINYTQDDVVRVKTELITVPVSVMDKQGRYLTDLTKENFQLFENGVEQEVAVFEPVEQPFTIILLVDVSISMKDQKKNLSAAVDSFVRQLNPEDTLIYVSFAEDIYYSKPVKIKDLKKAISIGTPGGEETRIYDAVWSGLRKIRKFQGRKAIVLFSDGDGTGKYYSSRHNYEDATESEAIIYTVQFDTLSKFLKNKSLKEGVEKDIVRAGNYMQKLADLTGGRRYQVADVSDLENLEKTFAQVTDEIRRQYSLGYYPKETGKKGELRQVKVRVNVPNVSVRSRDSYIVK